MLKRAAAWEILMTRYFEYHDQKIIDFLVFFIYIIVQNTEYFTRYKTTLSHIITN